ncbi:MAG: FHA domain-containing protein [Anaerolineales bacterium]|nr:FHA domain-containing protein [Anaerolineales bacterium]
MHPIRRFITRTLPGCLLLITLGFFVKADRVRSQAVPATLQIIKVDSSAFPEIKVQILLLGPGGLESAAPSRESLTVSENNKSVEVEIEKQEIGAEIGFVMDAGTGLYSGSATGANRLQEMKDAISDLTQDPLLLTGKDIFYVIAQEPNGSQVLVNPETPATQIPNILSQYNPPTTYNYSYPLGGVSALLDFYAKENSAGLGRAQAIVVFSGDLAVNNQFPMASVVAKAKAMGIRVHTVLVRHSLAQKEKLEQLAAETGGRFFHYTAEGAVSLSGLKPLLTGIRTQYILTYRSPNPESGTRVVAVSMQYGQNEKPALSQYEITVEPPVAVIRSPGEDQTVSPESYVPTGDPQATPVSGIVVTASVSWPDGHPRAIRQATLLVNGEPQSVLSEPSDPLTFVWNPTGETAEGPATLQIQIEDELGLIGLSDQIVVRIEAASMGGFSFDFSLNNILAILAFLLAATAVVLVVVFRKEVAGTAQQAVGAATEFIQEVGETLRFKGGRSGASKAMLVDLDGSTGTGRSSFELFGTTSMGRSKKNADLVFQAAQPDSPISRLHCTILEEDGAYFLRDDQSANGTYLNGVRLVPMDRNPLKDGDEIQLASPERNGVRLQFRWGGGGGSGGMADTESTNRMSRE